MNNQPNRPGGNVGFLGAGAMAEAMMAGAIARGVISPADMCAYDIRRERLEYLHEKLGIQMATNVSDVLGSKIIFLAVKPQHLPPVLDQIAPYVGPDHLVVSVAAGVTTRLIEERLGGEPKIIRLMPNTPCLVGQGAIALSRGRFASEDHAASVVPLLQAVGEVVALPEEQLDAVTGLSGSGPAYICMIIEAMADGAVAAGLPRDIALQLASQTVAGTGQWVKERLEAGEHPAVLREQVTSPGGTTARGLEALEKQAVRAAFSQAVQASANWAKQLGKGT